MKVNLIKKADKISKILFYFCYTGLFAYPMLRTVPALEGPLWILYKVCLALLVPVGIFAIRNIPKKKLPLILIIGMLVVINKIITDSDDFVILFLLIISAKGIKFENILKYDLCMKIPALIILPMMYFSGLTGVYTHYRGEVVRQSMGFYNPNYFSSYLMSAIMEILYLRRDKIGWKEILLTIASCGIIGYFSDSRTQMISIALLVVLIMLNKIRKQKRIKNWIAKFFIYNSAFILAISSLGFSVIYMDNSLDYSSFNNYTSGRVNMSIEAIREYGVSLVGNKESAIANLKEESIILDNVYVYIFSVHGAIMLLMYCIFVRKYFKYLNTEQEILLMSIMLCFSVSGLATRACMRPRFNVFLLYYAYLLYGNPSTITKKELKEETNG